MALSDPKLRNRENSPVSLAVAGNRASWIVLALGAAAAAAFWVYWPFRGSETILNVSYDGSRSFYADLDAAYMRRAGSAKVQVSHAASGSQARGIIAGLAADVATLGAASDIDRIVRESGIIARDWRERLPNHSSPYASTIVFVVRAGNPHGIKDWQDLVEKNVEIVAPSPRRSAAGRWAYLAAWGYALKHNAGDDTAARRFVESLYSRIPLLDTGARAAVEKFKLEGEGDVLLTWENEAWDAIEDGRGGLEVVYPSLSILAQPVVAIVDANTDKRGTRASATAYAEFLFTPEAQEIAAANHLRPCLESVARRHVAQFPPIELFKFEDVFGDWQDVERRHFDKGGIFDSIHRLEDLKRSSD